MVTLDYGPIPVSLAAFDNFWKLRVDLKHKLFTITVIHRSDPDVFKRNDAFWDIFCRVLEVVQTSIVENKPTPLPGFPASSL